MRALGASRTSVAPGGVLAGPWVQNSLWTAARAVPSLDLRFADNKSLVDAVTGASLVTFTRASSGTSVGSDGVIKTATTNLLLRSEEFDNASWAKLNNVTVTANATTAPNGFITADKIVEPASSADKLIVQPVTLIANTTYTASVYFKAADRPTILFHVRKSDYSTRFGGFFNTSTNVFTAETSGGGVLDSFTFTNVGGGWYRCSITGNIGANTAGIVTIYLANSSNNLAYTGDGTSGIYLWGAQLEQSSTVGEYIPTTSTINSAPRFDHNPITGESLGLLVEESRTNLLLQSQDFATTWGGANITIASNSTTAPDGTTTADTLTHVTASSERVQACQPFTANSTVTISIFAKKNTSDFFRFELGNAVSCWFNLNTGVIGSNQAGSGNVLFSAKLIQPFPDGWYRCVLTCTTTTITTILAKLFATDTDGASSSINSSVYLWGAQLEQGALATSPILTSTAAVTRSASLGDLISSAIANNIRSFYVEFSSPAVGTRGVVSLNDNTANERASVLTSGTDPRLVVQDGGVEQANIDGGTVAANVRTRVAVRINANDFAISINGGAVVTDTSGTLPTVDRLMFGRTQAGEYLNGTIARFTGWSQLLPNATLQTLAQ